MFSSAADADAAIAISSAERGRGRDGGGGGVRTGGGGGGGGGGAGATIGVKILTGLGPVLFGIAFFTIGLLGAGIKGTSFLSIDFARAP